MTQQHTVEFTSDWRLGHGAMRADLAHLLTQVPGVLCLLNRIFWQKDYDRVVAPLRSH